MSKENATPKSKFSLVRAIAAKLNLGEEGKLDNFFAKVVKTLTREMTALKKNLDTRKFNYEQELDELHDKLVDAQDALAGTYESVDVDSIKTNEDQNNYIDVYLNNINRATQKVRDIEARIKNLQETYEECKEEIEKQIEAINVRIETVGKE